MSNKSFGPCSNRRLVEACFNWFHHVTLVLVLLHLLDSSPGLLQLLLQLLSPLHCPLHLPTTAALGS